MKSSHACRMTIACTILSDCRFHDHSGPSTSRRALRRRVWVLQATRFALAGDQRQKIEYLPFQEHAARFPQISTEQFGRAVHLIEPDGTITHSAQAVFRIAALSGKRTWLSSCYEYLPGFAGVTELGYSFIAFHRNLVDRVDRMLFGSSPNPTSHRLTVSFFLRAGRDLSDRIFVALGADRGVDREPRDITDRPAFGIDAADSRRGEILEHPDAVLDQRFGSCVEYPLRGGVVMSVLLIVGVLPFFMLIGLWAFYLSLVIAGQDFLSFQWDTLLLEAGFAALFVAPLQLWLRSRGTDARTSHIGLWLLRWLAFRIMFLSGMTKLLSGDTSLRNGTALTFHYWTQPLPPWTAWYMNRLPLGFTKFSVWSMFFAELVVPFFVFTPRIPRRIAFWGIVLFQLTIALTGNYGFFNILTMVICIPLLEDAFFQSAFVGCRPFIANNPGGRFRHHANCAVATLDHIGGVRRRMPVGISLAGLGEHGLREGRAVSQRQWLRAISGDDQATIRNRDRRQRRWRALEDLRFQVQARRHQSSAGICCAAHAAVGLADVVRGAGRASAAMVHRVFAEAAGGFARGDGITKDESVSGSSPALCACAVVRLPFFG